MPRDLSPDSAPAPQNHRHIAPTSLWPNTPVHFCGETPCQTSVGTGSTTTARSLPLAVSLGGCVCPTELPRPFPPSAPPPALSTTSRSVPTPTDPLSACAHMPSVSRGGSNQ